jgi:hypothetical protein
MTAMRSSLLVFGLLTAACSGDASMPDPGAPDASPDGAVVQQGRVHVVLFTHIEDNTPQTRTTYLTLRAKLIELAQCAATHDLPWVLQPDWKMLEAARMYEDAATTASTGGKNFLRYLHEDLGVAIDPHSHENGGYNYTDVAYLLEQLGVGGSTVIGGHIWDPTLVQFSEWDRFRVAHTGTKYPTASWRGDLLIGAGTPNHVNDPLVSGVWRPLDRDHYFDDDPNGNIVSVGSWHDDAAGVEELTRLYTAGTVAPDALLTASWNINPASIGRQRHRYDRQHGVRADREPRHRGQGRRDGLPLARHHVADDVRRPRGAVSPVNWHYNRA